MAEIKVIQFKRGQKAVLEAKLTSGELGVLLAGEPAWETDTYGLKIGDGIHNYAELPYITGSGGSDERFVIEDPEAGQVLLYDEILDKWVNKDLADNNSIIYLAQHGLTIKGYDQASHGNMLVKDNIRGLAWIEPVSDAKIQEAVAEANHAKDDALYYANQAGNEASEAAKSATTAGIYKHQIENLVEHKFWWGTITEYNEEVTVHGVDPERFYFITAIEPTTEPEN